MTRLPAVTGKVLISVLCRDGWVIKGHKGSHVKLVKSGIKHPIIIPDHGSATIPKGTLRNILRSAGITVEELITLL